MITRLAVFVAFLALAGVVSWLAPRLSAPLDKHSVATRLISAGRADEAVHLFRDHEWRGVAEYRAKRFRRALGEFFRVKSVSSYYNMGNAYARLHEWSGAIEAYRRVLDLHPDHENARHNLAIVQRAEAQEKRDRAATRKTRRLGKWEDGNRKLRNRKTRGKSEKGNAEGGKTTAAKTRTGAPGSSDRSGLVGDKAEKGNNRRGPADAMATGKPPAGKNASAGGTAVLTTSTQDLEILMQRIKDDPRRVLAARLHAVHRQRAARK